MSIQRVGGDLVILDRDAGLIHRLNDTATLIWQGCDAGRSHAEVARLLAARYEIDEEAAAREVVDTLEKLRALNLVRVVE